MSPNSNETCPEVNLSRATPSALSFISIHRMILSGYRWMSASIFEPVKHPASIISQLCGISCAAGRCLSRKNSKYFLRNQKFASEIIHLSKRVL
jgi:hypothetical protein